MAYYVGTSTPVDTSRWNKNDPGFYISSLEPRYEGVRRHLVAPHVYFVGSHTGCGCGFRKANGFESDDPEEFKATREDHAAFARFLRGLPLQSDVVQIYVCWDGDEGLPSESHRTITPEDIARNDFGFLERELLTVLLN
jgi:hypothetical protein